jgi:hypothetical protein
MGDTLITRNYNKPTDEVFHAVLQAAQDAALKVKKADEEKMYVELSKGVSGWSWGEKLEVNITQSGNQSVVYIKGKKKLATNIAADASSPVMTLSIALDKRLA